MSEADRIAALEAANERLESTVRDLVRQINRLRDDPLGKSMLEGTRRIPFGTRFRSPLDAGANYVLVREAGGNAAFVDAPASTSDWSDA